MSEDYRLSLLDFPAAQIQALPTPESITNVIFMPLARRLGDIKGVLSQSVVFGAFDLTWKVFDILTIISTQHFVLHDGPKGPAEELLLQAGLWQNQLHNEVWVFNQGFWSKNSSLWSEVQKSSWDDVVLKEEFKKALQKDIYSFFEAEEIYKELSIPWKRGLIMYGPPGNGKTISIKAIIKTCAERGLTPLYVKSFQSKSFTLPLDKCYKGEEGAMQDVFEKARQTAPCVLILEDLDSLINDRNRSFFLNQIDGLEGNDGLLVIGSTNHFDRLDPALSTRPSRFDRKYLFDDPDLEERVLYAKFWQNKLKANKRVSFPDTLVEEAAASTDQFSYAYLKEAL
ncbi:hypothetical protein SERLADRAFT_346820 [Serpula lacrymans var. lacrymans S7.9]|nr:uncharacterized protein SERLADRAFT_346820 [Serpula lacrymans var. lacrymans S7.9]EGO27875.1 hypothetical protein SERLADRAFT_346820 [Serpula lacrymans var. lacrymans S7.9]